ncbi:MAG TPA: DUF1569 domain-containing protein [Candidatus Bathyarchaeia archaeon]|nr:DUF1569 domain-containing protein [Candidatus Bathyarchaeia archaeon]
MTNPFRDLGSIVHFDHDYLVDVINRLQQIKPDAIPRWGTLTPSKMFAHLIDSVRYSMGKAGDLPDKSNWLSRRILAPLILRGIVKIPKNVKGATSTGPVTPPSQADLETLHAVLEDYLALVQAGELEPKPHPVFGHIGVDGWDRLHVLHFEHHLRQFNV